VIGGALIGISISVMLFLVLAVTLPTKEWKNQTSDSLLVALLFLIVAFGCMGGGIGYWIER
jgi:NhaP-type Na+/H+ or K+/H+ antiporter